ncbi:MAG: pyrroloquinoline quinone biosynthesis protein B [Cyanobacteria bacterium PR.3.49]|nr:pyrroloquinoline quinone biosynthesis protein B [Cyanobacteria bacterium PR.3.49]
MQLIVLGTGAGGGCPQWNCGCFNCIFARENPQFARTTDALAVHYENAAQTQWAIVNPGVDLRHQLAQHVQLQPPKDGPVRKTPIQSVILTDGELDHTMGLINLREGAALRIFVTDLVLELMESIFPVRSVLKNYARLEFVRIVPGEPFFLGETVKVTATALSNKLPRYAADAAGRLDSENSVIGLKFESAHSSVAYAPQIGLWDEKVNSLLGGAEIILADGTFYTSAEMSSLGLSAGSAESMGHLPLSGEDGILAHLKKTKARVKLLTHINNTNPILRDNSPERQAVENAGVRIAVDGMCLSTSKVKEKLRD